MILTVEKPTEEKFLHKKTELFDFKKFTKKEINTLIKGMREIMVKADGIGLAANQIGINTKMFVALVPVINENGKKEGQKFYAIFNPVITKEEKEKHLKEEGCLSVPGKMGVVPRAERITLEAQDKNGKKIKMKAWGILAHVFQHEVDHLNGTLFIDKAEKVYSAKSQPNDK